MRVHTFPLLRQVLGGSLFLETESVLGSDFWVHAGKAGGRGHCGVWLLGAVGGLLKEGMTQQAEGPQRGQWGERSVGGPCCWVEAPGCFLGEGLWGLSCQGFEGPHDPTVAAQRVVCAPVRSSLCHPAYFPEPP